MIAIIVALFLCAAIWICFEMLRKERVVEWHIEDGPEQGVRIGLIADPHVGWPAMPLWRLRRAVDALNAQNPDIIVLLGDYRARYFWRTTGIPIKAVADELTRLQAPLGVFGILGNHDWWDDKPTQFRGKAPCISEAVFRTAGIVMLENENVIINGRFNLIGLGDQWAFSRDGKNGVDDMELALRGTDPNLPYLLLAHEPDVFEGLLPSINLTLSGHTHGGQVKLFGWTPMGASHTGNKYVYGHYKQGDMHLVVSGGLGYSVLPFRFGVPSEINIVHWSQSMQS